jgi:arsenate reductase
MPLPSDDQLTLLHNPRCSKSRAALALLEERGARFETRLYLEDPLSRDELVELGDRLGRAVREWTRKGEAAFGEAGLGSDADDSAILDAMAEAPILMERPILVGATRAIVGRPPDDIVGLL